MKPQFPYFRTFLFFLPLLLSFQLYAQADTAVGISEISGQLLDESKIGVMYASIALLQDDSVVINSAISTPTGNFRIDNVAAGTYQLRVEHLEYETYTTAAFTLFEQESRRLQISFSKPLLMNWAK